MGHNTMSAATFAMIAMGDGKFTTKEAERCGALYKAIMADNPQLEEVALFYGTGALDDTPQARAYIRQWARHAGLDTEAAICGSKLVDESKQLLMMCCGLTPSRP